MALLTTQGMRIIQVLVASTIVLTLFFTLGHFGKGSLTGHARMPGTQSAGFNSANGPPAPKPANATLDFQEIIFLSMPYRTDRQDQMSLIAAVSGLKLTMIPGIKPDDMHPKSMPGFVGKTMAGRTALGVWRAHANAWRYIIDNNLQSALIIEDDVDWDVNVKDIFGALNWQLKYNNTIRWGKDNVNKGWNEECPYGCDWDELFVGQCGGGHNEKRLDLHSVYTDPDTSAIEDLPNWAKTDMNKIWNQTQGVRVISPTYTPFCLMGYGVSRMGAMRMLYNIGGWRAIGSPVDNEIAFKSKAGRLSGYTITPPAITSWRVGGSQDSDNDPGTRNGTPSTDGPSKGHSLGLKRSVRKSLEGYFKKDYWGEMERRFPVALGGGEEKME